MIYPCKALDLKITDSEYHHDLISSCVIIPSQTSNPKHVEIQKVLHKPTYDTSL